MTVPSHRVARRLARDAAQAVVVLAVVVTFVFVVVRLIPGNPAEEALGNKATPQAIALLKRQLGLDRSSLSQFLSYFASLLHGNMGYSLVEQGRTVDGIVFGGLGVTAALVTAAIALSIAVGVPLGLWSALTRRPLVDSGIRSVSILLLAAPPFFIGLLLILVFSLNARILPAGGWGSGWPEDVRFVLLPAAALSAYLAPIVIRTVRQAAIETMAQPFVEATLARGISPRRVALAHILPNSLLPLITLIALNIGWLISGAVVVEIVFALPGLGTVLQQAVAELDYSVIEGVAIVSATVVVVSNLLADVVGSIVDPRIRHQT